MSDLNSIAKIIILTGISIALVGLIMLAAGKISWIGKLPGDIYIKRDNFSFYFPITTSILLSILLSIAIFFFKRR